MPRTKDNAKREEGKSADKARGPGKSKGRVAHTGTSDPDVESTREQSAVEAVRRANPSLSGQETRRTPPPEELPADGRKGQEKLKDRADKVVDELKDILDGSTDPILNTKLRDCVRIIQR